MSAQIFLKVRYSYFPWSQMSFLPADYSSLNSLMNESKEAKPANEEFLYD